jgi:hypothetical protein
MNQSIAPTGTGRKVGRGLQSTPLPIAQAYVYSRNRLDDVPLPVAIRMIENGRQEIEDLRINRDAPKSFRYPADWSAAGILDWLADSGLTFIGLAWAGSRWRAGATEHRFRVMIASSGGTA